MKETDTFFQAEINSKYLRYEVSPPGSDRAVFLNDYQARVIFKNWMVTSLRIGLKNLRIGHLMLYVVRNFRLGRTNPNSGVKSISVWQGRKPVGYTFNL